MPRLSRDLITGQHNHTNSCIRSRPKVSIIIVLAKLLLVDDMTRCLIVLRLT